MDTTTTLLPPTGTAGGLMNDAEAAQYLGGIEKRTLREWRRTRALPHIKLTAKHVRYRQADLDTWIARHRVAIVG